MPVELDLSFRVNSTAGAGIDNLKGAGISAVYMHSSSPSAANPNPQVGTIIVEFQDPYFKFFGFDAAFRSPPTGGLTPTQIVVTAAGAALTVGVPYIIDVLGTTTTAQWHTLGVPAGATPAVGMVFIAAVTGIGAGTGQVSSMLSTDSNATNIALLGDPSLMIKQSTPRLIFNVEKNAAVAAPSDGSFIYMKVRLSNSSVIVPGE